MFIKLFGTIATLVCLFFIIIFIGITYIFGIDTCSKDLIESVKSPNGEYTIKTYLRNCGATVDFEVVADLCDKNNECDDIYHHYHERDSFVYWIDNDNVSINQKKLNIHKDKFNNYDYDNRFILYSSYKLMYFIDKENNKYKISPEDAYYIDKYATSMFIFNKYFVANDYNLILRIVDSEKKKTNEYLLKIDDNKMYLINSDKMSELNRTDYEYMKKILTSNGLYNFS